LFFTFTVNIMKQLTVIFSLLLFSAYSNAQNIDDIIKSNKLITAKQYNLAIPVLEKLISENSTSNLNYKLGLCYFNLNREIQAIPFFEKGLKYTTKKYKHNDIGQESSPKSVYYYYAKCQHINGNLILAFEYYDKFYNSCKKKCTLKSKALTGMFQCDIADDLKEDNSEFITSNLGDTLNTNLSESRPVISLDGSIVYFTSNRLRPDKSNENSINEKTGTYFQDIYVSYRTESGKWTDPNYLPFCKATQSEASVSMTLNGDQIFVYQGGSGNGDIYSSTVENISFENLKPFPAKALNSNHQETHITMSIDGEFAYFVSNRPGGFGGKDIYRIRKLPDGTWSKALNLGPTINSSDDEESPFIGADNKTLYFSSNGKNSMGGYDIFVSQINTLNEWSTPENLGSSVNSFDDDLYYSTMANGFLGIYASDSKRGLGDYDIYFVQTTNSYYKNVTIFKGYIKTQNGTELPKGISIHVKDLIEESKEIIFTPRQRDGGYILNLKPCHSYSIEYKYKGKIFYSSENLIPCNSSYQELHEEIILNPINFKVINNQ